MIVVRQSVSARRKVRPIDDSLTAPTCQEDSRAAASMACSRLSRGGASEGVAGRLRSVAHERQPFVPDCLAIGDPSLVLLVTGPHTDSVSAS